MSDWREAARAQQVRWKGATHTLPDEARVDGTCFRKKLGTPGQWTSHEEGPHPHCLPRAFATHNLLATVRDEALARFHRYNITWEEETPRAGLKGDEGPTTNLLNAQVQCVNSLLSLELTPDALLTRVQTVVPGARKLVPIRHLNQAKAEGLVAFGWIGRKNYLKEKGRPERVRGGDGTSADALIVAEREAGRRTGILVDWTYTEPRDAAVPFISEAGVDLREVYRPLYEGPQSPFGPNKPPIDAFFQQPCDQLLRLTLLAQAMRQAKELGVDSMVVLALAPSANQAAVPPGLAAFGATVQGAWGAILSEPNLRLVCQDTAPWLQGTPELSERYGGA